MSHRRDPRRALLSQVLPEFTEELRARLVSDGESDLADQLGRLEYRGRCGCGDALCATFYTAPPPQPGGSWGAGHENVVVDYDGVTIVLDVVDARLVCVEPLSRPDVAAKLSAWDSAAREKARP